MRNRRLATLLTGALLTGSLIAGAGFALATADDAAAPVAAAAAPAAPLKADAGKTVDVLASLGTVTRRVGDLVSSANRKAGITEVRDRATTLGSAAEALQAAVKSIGTPSAAQHSDHRDVAGVPTVDEAVAALKRDVQALLTAIQANDPAAISAAINSIARDTFDLVRAIIASLDGARPVTAPVS